MSAGEHGFLPKGCGQGVCRLCSDELLGEVATDSVFRGHYPLSLLGLSLLTSESSLGPRALLTPPGLSLSPP